MCVLLYPVYLGVCHLSSAARNCVLWVLPAIPAVVRSCHGRVCTIRFLLGMQQLVQLLPAFESRQKIDLLNSISLIFLLGSPNNLKSWLWENSGTSLIMFLSSWLIANLWGKAVMGSACPGAAEGEITARCSVAGTHPPSPKEKAKLCFQLCAGSRLIQGSPWSDCCCPQENRGGGCGDWGHLSTVGKQIPGFRSDGAESCFAVDN